MRSDPALDALALPLHNGSIALSEGKRVVFLHARTGVALQSLRSRAVTCVQAFKPAADTLQRDGFDVHPECTHNEENASLVMLLPPRQKLEARASLARALLACEEGGTVLASVPNDAGAKSIEADFKKLVGTLSGSLSKFHCRVFWAKRDARTQDEAQLREWAALDAPRHVAALDAWTQPGVFAWDRVDAGSALLIAHLPGDLRGDVADLGCGWGALSLAALAHNAEINSLDLYDADFRALQLAQRNLRERDSGAKITAHWHDVTMGLSAACFDTVLCNPPFHALDTAGQPDIGRRFIAVAAEALRPGGRALFVANRHLPYEAVVQERFARHAVLADRDGYKVICAWR